MTLYEILALVTPILVTIGGGALGYVFKDLKSSISDLDKRMNARMDKFEDRLGLVEKDLYFIKGLIEGKHSNR